MIKKYKVLLQYLIPQHLLSRLIGILANSHLAWLKNLMIASFIKYYNVDLSSAEETNISKYATFNDFFTRKLKDSNRPISQNENTIVSPADGIISQIGDINNDLLLQAKGHKYNLNSLLTEENLASRFVDGKFATIYLSPKDYHRVHMPITGTLQEMIYVPGKLFSVNAETAEQVPNLFARNERVISIFETQIGKMAVIMVGAMIVASIHTAWASKVAPNKSKTIQKWDYRHKEITFNSCLLREMRAIYFVTKLIDKGVITDPSIRRLNMHLIRNPEVAGQIDMSSALNTDIGFFEYMFKEGRKTGKEWLKDNYQHIGVRTSAEIEKDFI